VGEVVTKDGDIHGDGVNIAARIEPLAAAGGICISSAVHEQVRNKLSQPMAALGPAELKNIELPVVVHRVVMPWDQSDSRQRKEARSSKSEIRNPKSEKERSLLTSVPTKIGFATAVVLLVLGLVWWSQHHSGAKQSARKAAASITSLAVKPLDD